MDKLNRNFVRGNILKAEELNELVGKINEFAKCVNDNSLETNKAAMQSLKNALQEVRNAQLVIGTDPGTAFDGAAGATLEQTVRELAGGAGTMYSVYVRNNMASLGFAPSTARSACLTLRSSRSTGTVWTNPTSLPENSACAPS